MEIFIVFFSLDIEMKCNWRELFKWLFFILAATWLHYHTLPIFIITYQIMGIKYGTDEVAEETSSRIMESEIWKRICSLQFCAPWAQALATKNHHCSVLRRKNCGYVLKASLKGCSSYHWANSKSDYRAICRVPHNLSSTHGHLWELVGTLLIIMAEQQAWTKTAPGKSNHTVTPEMMCDSKNFSLGSQTISLGQYPIWVLSRAALSNRHNHRSNFKFSNRIVFFKKIKRNGENNFNNIFYSTPYTKHSIILICS